MTTALITGASSGIGMEIAKQLATHNYNLILVARREQKLLELAETLMAQHSIKVKVMSCDLSSREDLIGLMPKVESYLEEESLKLSVLVNNAGTGYWSEFDKQDKNQIISDIDLNVIALTRLAHDFVNSSYKDAKTSILNIASLAGLLATPNYAVYSATKAYVVRFSEILAYELRGSNTSITCVCPGGVMTEFVDKAGIELKGSTGMMSAESVAKYAIDCMHKKQLIKVPGLLNKVSVMLRFLPKTLQQKIVAQSMLVTVKAK